jgi:hypothetical protein
MGARPAIDCDELYGASCGAWTTDMFIEALYCGVVRDAGPACALSAKVQRP